MYLLDTNILIYYFNDDIPENQTKKISNILKKEFNISIITKMEFLGFRKHTEKTFQKAKEFINYSNSYNLNNNIVDIVIDIRRKYNIKLPDAIIASTALNNDFILVTRNEKDFKVIADLEIFNPYKWNYFDLEKIPA